MSFKLFYLYEMPHYTNLKTGINVDFQLEKSNWAEIMRDLVMKSDDIEELLKPFYTLSYGKLLKKRFDQLSDIQKSELREILPEEFVMDMRL